MTSIDTINKSILNTEIIPKYDFVICEDILINLFFKNNNFFSWPGGEEAKNLENYIKLTEELIKNEMISRTSKILVIGGGAFSDLVGFTLSTLFRGVSWSVVPSTLLAMVDAAIGGKTAVNTDKGKNLVGTFHFPEKVYLIEDLLSTLPVEEFNSGKGEILKYALLNEDIYNAIFNNESLIEIIKKCARYKLEITESDPLEKNDIRIQLNLGHTFGHGIERYSDCSHGEAVTWGISQIATMYSSDMRQVVHKVCDQLKLEIPKHKINFQEISNFIKKDKKNSSDEVRLVIPVAIGKFQIIKVTIEKLAERYEQCQ